MARAPSTCAVTPGATSSRPGNSFNDVWIQRVGASGKVHWQSRYANQFHQELWDVTTRSAGGLFIVGTTTGSVQAGHWDNVGDMWMAAIDDVSATRYCSPSVANSSGSGATIHALGSNEVVRNAITLLATDLPMPTFGIFIQSPVPGMVPAAGGQGTLCIGGAIGRYGPHLPYVVGTSGGAGTLSLAIDLSTTPTPLGPVVALPGETHYFQAWFRDANPTVTSNFSDAVEILLR